MKILHVLCRLCGWLVGANRNAGGEVVFSGAATAVSRTGALFAIAYLGSLAVLHGYYLIQNPMFGPSSNVEETAYTYTSARNFLRFGYLNSGLLQDFSNSPYPEDHPYVYSHMPPGPDLFTALLLDATGGSYLWTRAIFALIFLLGAIVYAKVAELVLHRFRLTGGAFVFAFIWPWFLVQGMDRLIYSPFLLLAFGPLVVLGSRHGQKFIAGALVALAAFIASIYIEYSLLSGVLAFWFLVYWRRVLPGGWRAIRLLIVPAGLGVLAHLVQNYLYMGHEVFWKELSSVLSNRVTGYPSVEELKDWYVANGLVHHGSQAIQFSTLSSQISENFRVFAVKSLTVVALMALVLQMLRVRGLADGVAISMARRTLTPRLRMFFDVAVATCVPVLVPIVLFPAFAQEVTLRGSGANAFFLAFLGLVAAAVIFQAIALQLRPVIGKRFTLAISSSGRSIALRSPAVSADARGILVPWTSLPKVLIGALLTLSLIYLSHVILKQRVGEFFAVVEQHRTSEVHLFERLSSLRGQVFMTNINVPTVGYLLSYPGFGVCGPESITPDIKVDTSHCKVSFARRTAYWQERPPTVFVFFRDGRFFPGFGSCVPDGLIPGNSREGTGCVAQFEQRLRHNFRVLEDNKLFTVFELTHR